MILLQKLQRKLLQPSKRNNCNQVEAGRKARFQISADGAIDIAIDRQRCESVAMRVLAR